MDLDLARLELELELEVTTAPSLSTPSARSGWGQRAQQRSIDAAHDDLEQLELELAASTAPTLSTASAQVTAREGVEAAAEAVIDAVLDDGSGVGLVQAVAELVPERDVGEEVASNHPQAQQHNSAAAHDDLSRLELELEGTTEADVHRGSGVGLFKAVIESVPERDVGEEVASNDAQAQQHNSAAAHDDLSRLEL
eukprot:SAG31_NODE_8363_length_1465_cov_2.724744_1_plen_195_part_01